MSRYVMKATGPADWRSFRSCEFGISIGNPNHEGDKFRSIIQWADKRFSHCIVTLSDTLNRYTMMCDGMDEAEAYFKTRKLGDLWIEQNKAALNSVSGKLTLKRWDEWLKHPDYEAIYSSLKTFRDSSGDFHNALKTDTEKYLERRCSRDENFDYQRAFDNSMNFFIEEIACYILIGRTYGALRAYPARDMSCFEFMRGPQVPLHLKGMERAPHLELNFKKKLTADSEDTQKVA